jgi:hypothetical protein
VDAEDDVTKTRKRRVSWMWLAVMLGVSVGALAACGSDDAPLGDQVQLEVLGTLKPADDPASSAAEVTVGLYGVNAYDLDVAANTFYLSGYMWLRWSGDIDPLATLEIANVVEEWGVIINPLNEEPEVLSNGDNLMPLRIQGRFFQPFDLRDYPLDSQELTLLIEDSTNTEDAVVYVPDVEGSGLDASFQVPGWKVAGFTSEQLTHEYGTSFGSEEASSSQYSTLKMSVQIERVKNLFMWKLLLPVLLVLGTNWLALMLHPRLIEVRTAMPATALLTTVFLQQSSLDALPQVSSLVLMDLIYVVAYVLIVVTFAQVIWANNRIKHDDVDGSNTSRIRRIDRISLAAQVVVGLGVMAIMVISRL